MNESRHDDAYGRLGINRVINASGKMTALGGTALSERVANAMAHAARSYVSIAELTERAGALIARYTGAQSGCVTSGASAGIVQMVAACIAGTDRVMVEKLPDVEGDHRNILLQAGHAVSFGAPITQMIRMGGGCPVIVGSANLVHADHLESTIDANSAAFLFVQSHHAAQKGMLPLETCTKICHGRGVPVLVDAAAEEDLRRYIALGVDGVTYSGGKAISGPTSGIIAGKSTLVAACRAQEHGIARPMKVGKEQIAGLLAALEAYTGRDDAEEHRRLQHTVELLVDGLAGLSGVSITVAWDDAGRAIPRAALTLDGRDARKGAHELLAYLRNGVPPIYLRGHEAGSGTVFIDPRPLDAADVPVVIARIRDFFGSR